MRSLRRAKRWTFSSIFVGWIALAAIVLWSLIVNAAAAPPGTIDDYARAPDFQVYNFFFGYVPTLLGILVVALLVAHYLFQYLERRHVQD